MQTKNITPVKWNTNKPPANTVVYVWYFTQTIRAIWTGTQWKTPDGVTLDDVTHWRPYRD